MDKTAINLLMGLTQHKLSQIQGDINRLEEGINELERWRRAKGDLVIASVGSYTDQIATKQTLLGKRRARLAEYEHALNELRQAKEG